MKKVIFLAGSLLLSSISIAQTYSAPASAGDNGTTNVYLGEQAGSDINNTGFSNVFVGHESGISNTAGFSNVFVGFKSGFTNTSSGGNVFVGSMSGENSSGEHNTFVGYRAGDENFAGTHNCFLGTIAGLRSVGDKNVFLGGAAGYNSIGSGNVALGYKAGYSSADSFNVFIGYQSGYNETGSNKLYISNSETSSPLVYGEFDSKELKFNASKVGIGSNFDTFPNLTGLANAASYRLFVRGGILAEEVRVRLQADWADYVFSDNYKLPSLKETEAFINENKHLPNMPSAKQVEEQGIEMGNIIKLQQEKIEELTLYAIEQEKRLNNQEDNLKKQSEEIEFLKSQMEILLSKK